MKPKLLDLFCCAGGAGTGYHLAGFEVVGVDHVPQPRYPFAFIEADALDFLRGLVAGASVCGHYLSDFAAIHASPPCQAFTTMRVMPNAREHPDLIEPTRELLFQTGLPWVMENVVGAPLETGPRGLFSPLCGVTICGSMFGLNNGEYELRRHRLFESTVPLRQPKCRHKLAAIGFYGDHARIRKRNTAGNKDRGTDIVGNEKKLALVRELMGIDWMAWQEATQAIPPAYTEFIGQQVKALLPLEAPQ